MQIWRLIPLLKAPGHIQMALDSWLLDQHRQGLLPPTLRFYTWDPPAISLGYHQRKFPEHWQQLSWNGLPVELVQRPTGGRAVLHYRDLTYAIVTSGLPGNRVQAYQAICEFLIQGWRSLGVKLDYGQAGRSYIHKANCFGTSTGADLVLPNGSKLIGSAQLRKGTAILQHGSIQLHPDPNLFWQVFGGEMVLADLPLKFQGELLIEAVTDALIEAASACFEAEFDIHPLSEAEWQAVQALL